MKTSDVFRTNVRAARERRGWTQAELAHQLDDRGVSIHPTAVTKLERGDRGVNLDEAVALAVTLGVPLPLLLLPTSTSDTVEVTPGEPVGAWFMWEWMRGEEPLPCVSLEVHHQEGAPLRAYDSFRSDQVAVREAAVEVDQAAFAGDDDRSVEAKARYADTLRSLAKSLVTMRRLGLSTAGLVTERWRMDMVKLGLEVE